MKNRLYVLQNIKKYTLPLKGPIIGLVLVSLSIIPTSLLSPKLFQILIDDVMRDGQHKSFIIVVGGLMGVYLLKLVIDLVSLVLSNRLLNSFSYKIRKDVFKRLSGAPFSFIEKKEVGELKMRILDDVDSLGSFIKEQVVDYISHVFMAVATICLSIRISVSMTMYCASIIPIVFLINYYIGAGTKKVNEEIRVVSSEYYSSTYNSLQFWREIKAQNSEKVFIERFKGYRNTLAKLGIKSIRFWAYREVFNDFKSNYLTKVFVYIIGAYFVIKQEISVGVLIMFSEYFSLLFSSLDGLNSKRVALKTNSPYYERIFETFSFPDEAEGKTDICGFNDGISVKNISFSYIEGHPVLKNMSFEIKKGDHIAVVGKTGCGKTTLAKLLVGLYKTDSGEISFDGVDIEQIGKKSLYNLIGMVMQDNYLFNMSIRDNLLLANEDASEVDLVEACKKANIYDYIMSLPDGFDTEIGERGVKLSGGQKQRISIAAALLKNPKILILDEATSSLDKLSEGAINDAINNISEEVTVIAITHKPATALKAEKVVVIEDGEITAIGTHNELLNKNKFYNSLMEASNNEK